MEMHIQHGFDNQLVLYTNVSNRIQPLLVLEFRPVHQFQFVSNSS